MKAREDITSMINSKKPLGMSRFDKPYRVLVADDSTTMRKIVSQQLRAEMFEICGEASNGQEALELYKELDPDAVTLDINMPIMDGIMALQGILNHDNKACVIMLSSEGQRQIVIDAIRMGAKGYIVKPPNKEKVCNKVKKALEDS